MTSRSLEPPVPLGNERGDLSRATAQRNIAGTLTLHLLSQEQSVESTPNGPVIVIGGMVDGLEGVPEHQRLLAALAATDVPQRGQYHPIITDLPVDNVRATLVPDSPDKANVRIRYAYPTGSDGFINFPDETAPPQIEIVSAVVPMTTEFCYVGQGNNTKQNQIVLVHSTQLDVEGPPDLNYQVGEVEIQVPVEIVRYRRRERKSPHGKARLYVGTVNSRPVFADAEHMWLCTKLGGPSDDGGQSYNVTYEFQRNVDSWDKVVVFRDPDTGYPMQIPSSGDNVANPNTPFDPSDPKMAAKCRVYREMDWNKLRLTL